MINGILYIDDSSSKTQMSVSEQGGKHESVSLVLPTDMEQLPLYHGKESLEQI